ncbi:hypothetical protein PPYR_07723 [Photinus pyralis]|uniref:RNA-directed DNA polymerase n=1 Tax=Photinus pyralis TaxID=7054 RepID=A0A5N4ARE2_PHOPY|nr:hypothetical protein PPYR_07723 [Photinus pyralis]
MYANIKRYYFWNNLKDDVIKLISKCNECQRHKHLNQRKQPLTITTTASSAFQKIYLDLVGPLNQDNETNRYILTIQCELSKFVEGIPIENKEAETVARAFVNNFILKYGIPEQIVTDQGTEFLAKVFKETAKLLGLDQINSTAYHHETLGALENSHKNLNAFLRIQVNKYENTWSKWVPFWCFSYNNTVHTETKYTPYELVFGKKCNLPLNILEKLDPVYNFESYPIELKFRLQSAWEDAKDNLIKSKQNRKTRLDENRNDLKYKFNDRVLLKSEISNKLEPLYKGPYKVIEDKSPNVIIKINNKLITVHKDRVKLYRE